MDLVLRDARPADADNIAESHVAAWRVGYAKLVPDTFLHHPSHLEGRRMGWQQTLTSIGSRPAPERLIVPEVRGRVVGFAHYGAEREPNPESSERGELFGFYLHPDWWGTGVADVMITCVATDLADRFAEAVLWVLKDNRRARRFYERNGWVAGVGDESVEKLWDGPEMDGLPVIPAPVPEIQHRTTSLQTSRTPGR